MKLLDDPKEQPIVPAELGDDFKNPKTSFPVLNYSGINWPTARFAYFGPDDPRIVRQMPKPVKRHHACSLAAKIAGLKAP